MVIVIDIGNSNISFGVFEEKSDKVLNYANIKTDKLITTDDLAIKYLNLRTLWNLPSPSQKDSVIICSVVPQIDYVFNHMFEKYYRIKPYFVQNSDIPLKLNYDYPNEIGADRVVNSYAGIIIKPHTNLIIVDFGTATTFDIVTENQEYQGGLIMTGIMSSLRALEEKASKLPHIDLAIPSGLIGKNTVDGIRSGIVNGTGAMVDELVRRISQNLNWKHYFVIVTGGLGQLIKESAYSINLIDQHLTLKGLYYIWKLKNA